MITFSHSENPSNSSVHFPTTPSLCFLDCLVEPSIVINQMGVIIATNRALTKERMLNDFDFSIGQFILEVFPELKQKINFPISDDFLQHQLHYQNHHLTFCFNFYPHVWEGQHLLIQGSEERADLMQLVLDSIPARVFWKDVNGNYLGANNLFASDCGKEHSDDLIGYNDYEFFPNEEALNYVTDDQQVLRSGKAKLNIEEPQTRPDGSLCWLQTSKVPIRNEKNEIIGIMGSYTDITERKQYQQLIEHQARCDHLTHLPNRLALIECIESIQPNGHKGGGLLFIDLDHFKTVNDSLGHQIGDELLKAVARRIQEVSQNRGFTCRLGGDEFAVLVTFNEEKPHEESILYLEGFANQIRDSVLLPYRIRSHQLQLGVSIGITQCQPHEAFSTETLNEADIAMYEAKSTGRNRIKFYGFEMRERVNFLHTLQSRLSFAIEKQELFLVIQPQFNANGDWIGGEVLLRWQNDELGFIPPNEFIPISEQIGYIHTIGRWVLRQVFYLIQKWTQNYNPKDLKPLSVNVSTKQFEHPQFINTIRDILRQIPIPTHLLEFEVTESILLDNEDLIATKLAMLKSMGFNVALDDFGTGYSCLSYISKLPIDTLKIDRSFVTGLNLHSRQYKIIDTILSLANHLDMLTIAEGVETAEELETLQTLGCQHFQGFWYSRPLSLDNYLGLVDSNLSAQQ